MLFQSLCVLREEEVEWDYAVFKIGQCVLKLELRALKRMSQDTSSDSTFVM